jgi:hypothetical protein
MMLPLVGRMLLPLAQSAVDAACFASVFFCASSRTRAERVCKNVGNDTWYGRKERR